VTPAVDYHEGVAEGVRFGSYELRALLGTGGMARVYRAVRTGPLGFEKEVAVKVLDPQATSTEDRVTSLTDEARLGGLLRHQNIVATDELGQVGPNYYIAMELVDGWPLERLLKEHATRRVPVPRAIIIEVMASICDGLSYAHALTDRKGEPLGLVHRDMKPGNVMIGRSGEVKIMDFGIAKATTNKYATAEQSTRGTPLFMSPEQVMGGDLDGRSDLFALGSMLGEMVTLQPTFGGDEVIAILRAVLDVDITATKERILKLFPEVLPIFVRCMEVRPADRYPDAAALAMELRAVGASLPEGIKVRRWVDQFGPILPAAQTGELGAVLPAGLKIELMGLDPSVDREAITLAPEDLQGPQGPPSFEMPLGPAAGPVRGTPTPSRASPLPPLTAPNLAPPPAAWASKQLPPSKRAAEPVASALGTPAPWSPNVHGAGQKAYGPGPKPTAGPPDGRPPPQLVPSRTEPTPAPDWNKPTEGHRWDQAKPIKEKKKPRPAPVARPTGHSPRRPRAGKRATWQKRAAQRAAITRLATWAAIGLTILWGLKFIEGPIGETATGIWNGIFGG
jgi:eukaryotic-like serine/threonine-protein kinase